MWGGAASPRAAADLVFRRASIDDLFTDIDGRSSAIRDLKKQMRAVALDRDVTVLILGESGTGKERVARAIHGASPRSAAPFVAVNCAGLAPTLIEDELFGHVRGAFTGAVESRPGPFERASGGTVLLDEIGDLSLDLQMKLLRVLQERRVHRLGSSHDTAFDARIIAATNANLARKTADGRFREDLYYRLKVFVLQVPPVRSRGADDIERLSVAILDRLAKRRRRSAPTLHREALARLVAHSWPGNVRELENTLECMLVSAEREPVLGVGHLPPGFGSDRPDGVRRALPTADEAAAALEVHGFSRDRAAKALGVSRHQLYRLLRTHS
jgi:transcriptional regulator with PAS, ATPase and Fis domain